MTDYKARLFIYKYKIYTIFMSYSKLSFLQSHSFPPGKAFNMWIPFLN